MTKTPEIQINSLREQIRHHEYLYYVKSEPVISDQDFDYMMKELEKLESENPNLITPDSPTQRVGEDSTSFEKETHRVPMLSIDNSYNEAEIANWLERCEKTLGKNPFPVVAELKIDGVSGSFKYQEGLLQTAVTRGDGQTGDIITENARTIRNLPLKIASDFDMDIRGEIYTPLSTFNQCNEEIIQEADKKLEEKEMELSQIEKQLQSSLTLSGAPDPQLQEKLEKYQEAFEKLSHQKPKLFKNSRNFTSGTIKSLKPTTVSKRGLRVMVYGIAQAFELGFETHTQVMNFLHKEGFNINVRWKTCSTFEEITAFINNIKNEKADFDFDIDGIVLKIDNLAAQQELGTTAKSPRWALAYKYPQEAVKTKIINVRWQPGRTRLTPVADLEPVQIAGTTVSKATLHNADFIKEKDIRLGDVVFLEKAGYIIPQIIEPIVEERDGTEKIIELPTICPLCSMPTEITSQLRKVSSSDKNEDADPDEENSEQDSDENILPSMRSFTLVTCSNPECFGFLLNRTLNFVKCAEIEHFGIKRVEGAIESGLINKLEDIFTLNETDLAAVDSIKEKSAQKIIASIAEAAKQPLANIICALGIPNVGKVRSAELADLANNSLENFLSFTEKDLLEEEKEEAVIGNSVLEFIRTPCNKPLFEAIAKWWKGPDKQQSTEESKLKGLEFVFTGSATMPRNKLSELAVANGAKVKSSTTKQTDYLVIGSNEPLDYNSSKKQKAEKFGVKIINEFDFLAML
ncbi:MAG: NAD-dependent DNA ligase LigA [Candidatus Riflebacteria bacterium]|nr:NAD-dependent DNA ligase LigA [Candidatus Riflebacteria bacterium]